MGFLGYGKDWVRYQEHTGQQCCAEIAAGNEGLMREAETRGVPYLLKLRKTEKVKSLMWRMESYQAKWRDAGNGWEVMESKLQLTGWSQERRVVLVEVKSNLLLPLKLKLRHQGRSKMGSIL